MEIKIEQFKFDLGTIAQKVIEHTEEVFKHLNNKFNSGSWIEGTTIVDDNNRKLEIIKVNPNLSLVVKEYDDENEDSFEMNLESVDAYELIALLDYIKNIILKQ